MLILINKLASFSKSKSQRGEERKGKYLKRVVNGVEADGSPSYRYIRSEAELESYNKKHKTKITHEDQKKEHHKVKEQIEGSTEKTAEKKKAEGDKEQSVKKFKKEKADKKKLFILDSKNSKKVKKGIYV